MSLNHKEIDLVLKELALEGAFLQNIRQTDYHHLLLDFYKPGHNTRLLISLAPGKLRLHEISTKVQTLPRAPRFVEFLRSRVMGAVLESLEQVAQERIIRFHLLKAGDSWDLWVRLWGGSANVIVTDSQGRILEALFRRPRSGEVRGEVFAPHLQTWENKNPSKVFEVRSLPGEGSFNQRLESWYAQDREGDLEALRALVIRQLNSRIRAVDSSLEKRRAREVEYLRGSDFKTYGDILMGEAHRIQTGDKSLEALDYRDGKTIIIPLDPLLTGVENAQVFYKKYAKARDGLSLVQEEIQVLEIEKKKWEDLSAEAAQASSIRLSELKEKLGKAPGASQNSTSDERPGLSFQSGPFTIIVGRNAKENDQLLRRYIRGKDLWLHTRDTPGSYVFIKAISGKTIPLETLLDAGALALHYSKAKNEGTADLYYTEVKYLRRAKNGPLGLVIPTQEKNITIKADGPRLTRLLSRENPKDEL